MITVEALPAREGDCFWVEWDDGPVRRRLLIDGGTRAAGRESLARRLERQPVPEREFELVVGTHIDDDHIGGLVELLAAPPEGFWTHDFWFNGHHHLQPPDRLGPALAHRLTELLTSTGTPWNRRFGGAPVVVPEGPGAELPSRDLGGLRLTLLSPTWEELRKLREEWDRRLAARAVPAQPPPADLLGGPRRGPAVPWRRLAAAYTRDRSAFNGSSIALLAEHAADGTRVLFAADAHAEVLTASLARLPDRTVDLCTVPHHGSPYNVSDALLDGLGCEQWLLSTDGGRPVGRTEAPYRPGEGRHPSLRAMARLILASSRPTFWFNHRVPSTARYADPRLALRLGYRAVYPRPGEHGIALVVGPGGTVTRAPVPV
ncbi:MBL fold metallo-hydrolase [Streptomyces sp. NPDC093094]|uniref:MBL fold metallo-hydrolase n=1 Tax=Streptomyces sp. NPDC093094 TaxID=3366026 RepID=UPI0038217AD9